MKVFILAKIDDEYGHVDFKGVFFSREAGEEFAIREFPRHAEYGRRLYPSMEEFQKENGCEGMVLFETEVL